jgi:hypothetical protein
VGAQAVAPDRRSARHRPAARGGGSRGSRGVGARVGGLAGVAHHGGRGRSDLRGSTRPSEHALLGSKHPRRPWSNGFREPPRALAQRLVGAAPAPGLRPDRPPSPGRRPSGRRRDVVVQAPPLGRRGAARLGARRRARARLAAQ